MDGCKGTHCLADSSQVLELHHKYFVLSQQLQVETPQRCMLELLLKILWLELWQLWSQSTWILRFERMTPNVQVQAHSQCHPHGRTFTIENQSWAAVQGWAYTCMYLNELLVTRRHAISAKVNCGSTQVGEVECPKVSSSSLQILPEEDQGTIMATSTAVEDPVDAHHYKSRTALSCLDALCLFSIFI